MPPRPRPKGERRQEIKRDVLGGALGDISLRTDQPADEDSYIDSPDWEMKIAILETEPDLRVSMNRTECLVLLKELSEQRVSMRLTPPERTRLGSKKTKTGRWKTANVARRREAKASGVVTVVEWKIVDVATVFILAIALSGDDKCSRKSLAELIGLCQPITIKNLSEYIHRSWIKWDFEIVVELIHSTARNVGQPREGNDSKTGSLQLFRHVPGVIAKLLAGIEFQNLLDETATKLSPGTTEETQKLSLKEIGSDSTVKLEGRNFRLLFEDIFDRTNRDDDQIADEARDKGTEVGLMLAGMRRWLRDIRSKKEKNLDRVKLTLAVIFGGLSGVPVGGWAFSAAFPVLEKFLQSGKDDLGDMLEGIWGEICDEFVVKLEDEKIPRRTEEEIKYFESYYRWKMMVLNSEAVAVL
ncbi:unnamed protein product [Clonostachys rosea]|uniref:Uncharacterized protein n=1 Tax=Bionectria ochroleuca TaxID=29856 RepID=A0ABY6UPE7_BIOOC|nr:unnamed protein product [Clonostachys rosea]